RRAVATDVRAVLHDQGAWDGAGTGHRRADRASARRPDRRAKYPAGRSGNPDHTTAEQIMTRALRIAVADDERDTREYLAQIVTRLGHQVVTAATGQQLAELARVGEPDLIITDIKM